MFHDHQDFTYLQPPSGLLTLAPLALSPTPLMLNPGTLPTIPLARTLIQPLQLPPMDLSLQP